MCTEAPQATLSHAKSKAPNSEKRTMSIDLSAVSVVLTVSYDPGLATFPQYDSHLWVWVCSVVKTALLLPWKIFSRVACGVLDQFGIESQGPSCCWRRSRKCDCN